MPFTSTLIGNSRLFNFMEEQKLKQHSAQLYLWVHLHPLHPIWQVIDLVLRADVGLSYVVVRHLVRVEERVLESLAWARDSPLWGEIRANKCQLPPCQQVCNNTFPQWSWSKYDFSVSVCWGKDGFLSCIKCIIVLTLYLQPLWLYRCS